MFFVRGKFESAEGLFERLGAGTDGSYDLRCLLRQFLMMQQCALDGLQDCLDAAFGVTDMATLGEVENGQA